MDMLVDGHVLVDGHMLVEGSLTWWSHVFDGPLSVDGLLLVGWHVS